MAINLVADAPNPTHGGRTEIGFEVVLTHHDSVGGGPGTRYRLDGLPRVVCVETCSHGLAELVPIRFLIVQSLTIRPSTCSSIVLS